MKLKKNVKRVLAMLLVVAIVGTGNGVSTMAQSKRTEEKAVEQKEEKISAQEIAKQIADGTYKGKKLKETKYYETYEAADGSIVAAYYSSPIRYEDEDGNLKEYNSNLIETDSKDASSYTGDIIAESYNKEEYAYVNASGNSKQYFPEELDEDTPILLEKDEYSLSLVPVINDSEIVEGNDIEDDNSTTQNEEISDTVIKSEDNKVEYVKNDITYQYASMDNGVKENVIINEKTDKLTYSFSYALDGMYMKLNKKTNIIGLYDNKTDEEVAVIPAAYLNDNTGTNYNYDVETKISNKDNVWTIEYKLPESYMEDESTTYPVTLDPTVEWITYENVENPLGISFVIELSPGSGDVCQYPNAVNRFVVGRSGAGDYYKTYIQFNKLNKLLRGKQVNYAYAYVNVAQQVGGEMNVDMHEVTEDWNLGTLKWENEPSVDSEVLSQSLVGIEDQSYQIDFTKYCTMVAEEEADATQGVELRTEEYSKYMEFWGVKSQSGAPVFIVSYNSPEEIDATYDGSFQISAEYNEETANIDLSWEDSTQAATLYRVYKRTEDSFEYVGKTTEKTYEVETDDIETVADIRVMAVNQQGTQLDTTDDVNVLSNIVTFEKIVSEETDDDGNEKTTIIYEQTVMDTDGDELEDGYEIWDFKSLWNENTGLDQNGNKTYNIDTDRDGFPDGYEVFTLGTNPIKDDSIGIDSEGNKKYKDSDKDDLNDYEEFTKLTDPYLWDSDFDGLKDADDFGNTEPRKTDNPRVKGTDSLMASNAQVNIGLYDREYTETNEDGVPVTYVENIYRGDVKSIYTNYGDENLNKKMKYFYDEAGNNTAVIEENAVDNKYTICITYTYNEDGDVIFICDQSTKYSMRYDNGEMKELKVGNQSLVSYETKDVDTNKKENIIIYGENTENNETKQTTRTVVTDYDVSDDDSISTAQIIETYYGDATTPSYITELNNEGEILKLTDNTKESEISYTYSYTDNSVKVTRTDGFEKEAITETDGENKAQITTNYKFKNLEGEDTTYTSISKNQITEDNTLKFQMTLFNGDTINKTSTVDGKNSTQELYSNLYEKNIVTATTKEVDSTKKTLELKLYGKNKDIDYTYDKAGNITKVTIEGNLAYEYMYDVHGRLTQECDYTTMTGCTYGYSNTGNIEAKHLKKIDSDGDLINVKDIRFTYENDEWLDQLTKYNGNEITYDSIGNPIKYHNGFKFEWERGRSLSGIKYADNTTEVNDVTYEYNENGLRTYKKTKDTITTYEWDDTRLIRETIRYETTGKEFDIWYLYDSNGDVIGFEYSQFNSIDNELQKTRIYYEKNLQGDVIGLLDARGAEIAEYAYDAWGNVVNSFCYEGYEVPYALNHITYRSYYRDVETGFYYLQSRYYDPEICRFLNADDVNMLGIETNSIFKDNLYCYCNGDPVNSIDPSGYLYIKLKTLAKIVVYAVGFNPIATTLIYIGYKMLKIKITAKISAIAARIGSVCGPAGALIAWIGSMIGVGILVSPFVSALWDCVMQGKKGIEIKGKKSRWGFYYGFSVSAK